MKHCKEYDFILQAEEGEDVQEAWKHVLLNKRFEHKAERNLWHSTGNICIEYESYDKPSGIAATEAEYWTHELRTRDDKTLAYITFPTEVLRKLCNQLIEDHPNTSWRRGGENHKMEMLLVNLSRLFKMLSETGGDGDTEFLTRKQRRSKTQRSEEMTTRVNNKVSHQCED